MKDHFFVSITKKDVKELHSIAKILIAAGAEVGNKNGLPYCKNCDTDLISTGNSLGCIADKLEKQICPRKKTK